MSTPPPGNPWGQPDLPPPGAGQAQQPTTPPPGAGGGAWPPTSTVPVTSGGPGGGNNKKGLWVGLGVLAVAIIGVIGFVVLRGDDDDDSDGPPDTTAQPRGTRGNDEGDPDDAIDVVSDLVDAIEADDCDEAETLVTDRFLEEDFDSLCDGADETLEVDDIEVTDEDPVVVTLTGELDGDDIELEFEMAYVDDEWLVDAVGNASATGGTTRPGTTTPGTTTGGSGDLDEAANVAEDFVQGLIDGDCDLVDELSTSELRDSDELEGTCGSAPSGTEITTVEIAREDDPVVVNVNYRTDEYDDDYFPLEMVDDDGEWLVNGQYFDVHDIDDLPGGISVPDIDDLPGISVPDLDDLPGAGGTTVASGDPEEIARAAMEDVIDGDCSTALRYGTVDFLTGQGAELCVSSPLPPSATITGVETTSDDPVVVTVEVEVGGDELGIEVEFDEEFGELLIDGYSY